MAVPEAHLLVCRYQFIKTVSYGQVIEFTSLEVGDCRVESRALKWTEPFYPLVSSL